jgi:hypothetical protein
MEIQMSWGGGGLADYSFYFVWSLLFTLSHSIVGTLVSFSLDDPITYTHLNISSIEVEGIMIFANILLCC